MMGKRGQTQSLDFIMGFVVFLSVLSILFFFILPRETGEKAVPYELVQSAWFGLGEQGFLDGFLINESSLGLMNYSDLKEKVLLPLPYGVVDADFCLYVDSGENVSHFGPNSSSIEIFRERDCGGSWFGRSPRPSCKGNFSSARALSRPGYSVDRKGFVRMTLLVCGEVA